MAVYTLKSVQKIPVPAERAWKFFSDPANLAEITPVALGFKIISTHHGESMYPGQIIEYFVSPLAGIKLYWMTEITHVEEGKYFADEQRSGPYAFWQHQHFFRQVEGGVEMTDILHYKNPFGFLGRWMNPLLVKPKLKQIFSFRYDKVEELFGAWPGQVKNIEIS